MILLDTCALLWWTVEPEALSINARKAADRFPWEGCAISSITIWENRDPADRTIVATALMHDLPIMTKDEVINSYYSKVVW